MSAARYRRRRDVTALAYERCGWPRSKNRRYTRVVSNCYSRSKYRGVLLARWDVHKFPGPLRARCVCTVLFSLSLSLSLSVCLSLSMVNSRSRRASTVSNIVPAIIAMNVSERKRKRFIVIVFVFYVFSMLDLQMLKLDLDLYECLYFCIFAIIDQFASVDAKMINVRSCTFREWNFASCESCFNIFLL